MKHLSTLFFVFFYGIGFAQNTSLGIPDSTQNISFSGSNNQYSNPNPNPLIHNGSSFTNAPTAVLISPNSHISDYLYFYDLDLNVPANANITGLELIHTRGGCNGGSFVIDTIYLGYNQSIIGAMKRDSASTTSTDTLGAANDNWGTALTPAMVNDNSFGIILRSSSSGICTFGQFDIEVIVHYSCLVTNAEAIPDSTQNISFSGSNNQYSNPNPLNHNGNSFTNAPTAVLISPNSHISDYLYFYDMGFNVPANASITGLEIIHTRGGCNGGSFVIDTIYLAYNQNSIGNLKRDSASNSSTDTLGDANDSWGTALTPSIVNDNSFGVMLRSTSQGICTFGQFDLRVKLYYCENATSTSTLANSGYFAALFPNPATTDINLRVDNACLGMPYHIYNLSGQLVATGLIRDLSTQIDVRNLHGGMYFLRIMDTSGQVIKFVKL